MRTLLAALLLAHTLSHTHVPHCYEDEALLWGGQCVPLDDLKERQ